METVVKDAIQKGINEICFTDHVDYGVRDDWDSGKPIIYRDDSAIVNVNYPLYVKQISELQKKYSKDISINKISTITGKGTFSLDAKIE